jgi:16S rRNA (cytidine1402-2'-O)-methyltransferase
MTNPTLTVAATPIDGDWRRLDPRLVEALRSADLLIAEEQKNGMRLLVSSNITQTTPLILLNEHSTDADRVAACELVLKMNHTVFVSDAGTPCVADPDYRFVDMCLERGVVVRTVPGATSIMAALSVSGFATERFTFMGFPPRDKLARKSFFAELAATKHTAIFLERPYAMRQTLEDMRVIKQKVSVSVALGTAEEVNIRGTVAEVTEALEIVKKPFAVVVSASDPVAKRAR